jgi:hypothetical protein
VCFSPAGVALLRVDVIQERLLLLPRPSLTTSCFCPLCTYILLSLQTDRNIEIDSLGHRVFRLLEDVFVHARGLGRATRSKTLDADQQNNISPLSISYRPQPRPPDINVSHSTCCLQRGSSIRSRSSNPNDVPLRTIETTLLVLEIKRTEDRSTPLLDRHARPPQFPQQQQLG